MPKASYEFQKRDHAILAAMLAELRQQVEKLEDRLRQEMLNRINVELLELNKRIAGMIPVRRGDVVLWAPAKGRDVPREIARVLQTRFGCHVIPISREDALRVLRPIGGPSDDD